MSENTLCNFCSLQQIRSNARKAGLRVTLLPAEKIHGLGVHTGIDVLVHPRGMKREDLKKQRRRYFSAWLMELTDHCVC